MIYLIIYLLAGIYTAYFTIITDMKAEELSKFEINKFYLKVIIVSILFPPAGILATLLTYDRKYWRFI